MEKKHKIVNLIERLKEEYGDKYVVDNFEQLILATKNDYLSYKFLKNIKGANFKEHEKIILDNKNPAYNYYLLEDFEDADIEKHAQVIIDSKNPRYNYYCAKDNFIYIIYI